MPLIINVGLSKKASQNYQSTGVSINLTAEVDQGLLADPHQLQHRIDALYAEAEQAIDRQVNGRTDRDPPQGGRNGGRANGAAMTASQSRAIDAIARRLGIDPAAECRHHLGHGLDELTVRGASSLIDHLKTLRPPARNGAGGGGR